MHDFFSEFHMIIFKDDTIRHAKVEIENAARPQSYIQSCTDNKEWLGKWEVFFPENSTLIGCPCQVVIPKNVYNTIYTEHAIFKSVYVYAYLYTHMHRDIHKYMYAITISEERGQVFEGNWET